MSKMEQIYWNYYAFSDDTSVDMGQIWILRCKFILAFTYRREHYDVTFIVGFSCMPSYDLYEQFLKCIYVLNVCTIEFFFEF